MTEFELAERIPSDLIEDFSQAQDVVAWFVERFPQILTDQPLSSFDGAEPVTSAVSDSEKPIDLNKLAKDLMGNLRVNVAADKKRLAELGWNEPACTECSRLASRVEELEQALIEIRDGYCQSIDPFLIAERVLAGAHAEEKE